MPCSLHHFVAVGEGVGVTLGDVGVGVGLDDVGVGSGTTTGSEPSTPMTTDPPPGSGTTTGGMVGRGELGVGDDGLGGTQIGSGQRVMGPVRVGRLRVGAVGSGDRASVVVADVGSVVGRGLVGVRVCSGARGTVGRGTRDVAAGAGAGGSAAVERATGGGEVGAGALETLAVAVAVAVGVGVGLAGLVVVDTLGVGVPSGATPAHPAPHATSLAFSVVLPSATVAAS